MGQEPGVDLRGQRFHGCKVVARRSIHRGENLGLFALGQVFRRWGQQPDNRHAQQRGYANTNIPARWCGNNPAREIERFVPNAIGSDIFEGCRAACGTACAGKIEPGRSARYNRDGSQHRGENRGGYRDRHVRVELASFLRHKGDRNKNQDSCHGGCKDCRPHLLHAIECGVKPVDTAASFQLDALQHHDAVIQRHAYSKSNTG